MSDCPCQTALEALDLVHENDLSHGPAGWTLQVVSPEIPGLKEAWTHFQACHRCQQAMSRIWQFDRDAGAVIRNVPVPSSLVSRLVDAAEVGAVSQTTTCNPRPRSRRFAAALVACCLVIGLIGTVIAYDRWNRVSLDEITAQMVAAVYAPRLSTVEPRLPLPRSMALSARSDCFSLPVRSCHGEAYYFPVQARQDSVQRGILVAIPLSRVHSPPECLSYLGCHNDYIGAFVRTAWIEKDTVYICLIQRDEQLHRARWSGNPG
jgi:hypothetical protein